MICKTKSGALLKYLVYHKFLLQLSLYFYNYLYLAWYAIISILLYTIRLKAKFPIMNIVSDLL